MTGILAQLCISPGGMPKLPIPSARVTRAGVQGDWQTNRKYHGGPDRAICLFSEELYEWLRAQGVAGMVNGSVGENFTTRGIDLLALAVGHRLSVGAQCVIEITDIREPCRQLKKWDNRFPKLIAGRSGWMAKVVEEGTVNTGETVTLAAPAPGLVSSVVVGC